ERSYTNHAGPASALEPEMVTGREANRPDDARAKGIEVGHTAAKTTGRSEVDESACGRRQAALSAGPRRVYGGRFHTPVCRSRRWRHSASPDVWRLECGRALRRDGRNGGAR